MTITLTLPAGEKVYTGRPVTFQSPCASEGVTGVVVNGITYALVNAGGTALVENSFVAGAMVSVVFNVDTQKAYVQNADTNAYLEGQLSDKYSPSKKPSAADVGAVPTTRKVNGKALSSDITLSASDVSARPNTWTPSASDVGAVPTSRKVNGKALSSDITLSASDVNARPSTWTPSAGDVGAVPTTRKINGRQLNSDVTLVPADVGCAPAPIISSTDITSSTQLANGQSYHFYEI